MSTKECSDNSTPNWALLTEDLTEDLPDILPGEELEIVCSSTEFIVLRHVLTRGAILIHLQIGDIEVPFELDSTEGPYRTYTPRDLNNPALRDRLIATNPLPIGSTSIAIAPNLEIRARLNNEESTPTRPRAALLVHEEI